MLKHALVILVLALTQAGCDYGEDIWPFERERLRDGIIQTLERQKRDCCRLRTLRLELVPSLLGTTSLRRPDRSLLRRNSGLSRSHLHLCWIRRHYWYHE